MFRQRQQSVKGVSCDQLADAVLGYLEKNPQLMEQHLNPSQQHASASTSASAASVASVHGTSEGKEDIVSLTVVATLRRKQVMWRFVDRLVLSGYLALYNEANDPVLAGKLDDFARPNVLFVTASASTASSASNQVSVWSLRDDAIMAGSHLRAGKISKMIGGKDAYFVLDGKRKVLYWFDSDGSTEAKSHIALPGVTLQSSGPYLVDTPGFAVKVGSSLYMIGQFAADWINPMIACGAVFDRTVLKASMSLQSTTTRAMLSSKMYSFAVI